jgi:ribose-phosphate pyrophosphokinase
MITLDLVNSEKSQIKYKISQFPDGQQTVDLTDWNDLLRYEDAVKINSRLNTFKDLELIICATAAVRNIKPNREIALYVPYFMGARSDRKFVDGGINYLKQVICPIINSLNFVTVITLDPHSDVLEACLNNYEKVNNHLLVKHALSKIDNKNGARDRICLVSPDAGAYKKIFDVAKKFGIENIITATKVRDMRSGNILRTEIPTLNQHADLKYVIIDDICDGGRTFIELAKAIKGSRPSAKVYLVVTHGIFTAGFEQLNQYFEGIYTTNSYVDVNDPEFNLKNDNNLHKLTQFNVI